MKLFLFIVIIIVMLSCVVMWKTDRSNVNLRSTSPGLDIDVLNRDLDTVKRTQKELTMKYHKEDTLFIESDTIK